LIVSGRLAEDGQAGVWRIPLDGGAPILLAPGERPRSAVLSPSGGWVAFYLALERDPSRNGVWIVDTSGNGIRSLSGLASYRWGREGQLLFIPYAVDQGLSLQELDLHSGKARVFLNGDAFLEHASNDCRAPAEIEFYDPAEAGCGGFPGRLTRPPMEESPML
jgi:hypothetical protein